MANLDDEKTDVRKRDFRNSFTTCEITVEEPSVYGVACVRNASHDTPRTRLGVDGDDLAVGVRHRHQDQQDDAGQRHQDRETGNSEGAKQHQEHFLGPEVRYGVIGRSSCTCDYFARTWRNAEIRPPARTLLPCPHRFPGARSSVSRFSPARPDVWPADGRPETGLRRAGRPHHRPQHRRRRRPLH